MSRHIIVDAVQCHISCHMTRAPNLQAQGGMEIEVVYLFPTHRPDSWFRAPSDLPSPNNKYSNIYIYIYIYALSLSIYLPRSLSLSLYIYIYIYINTHIHTHTYIHIPPRAGPIPGSGRRVVRLHRRPERRVLVQLPG